MDRALDCRPEGLGLFADPAAQQPFAKSPWSTSISLNLLGRVFLIPSTISQRKEHEYAPGTYSLCTNPHWFFQEESLSGQRPSCRHLLKTI
ncbi:hypothetical protein TNCV_398761 [Trichonephila clavipes]|uniref:Uncharacterized protein n=1 Tax=Trichonephila clavipes TaxID=2585209 RepID=A0A8X6VTV5_TRICX|nr:hypothetical protein TNCV_398761 [Trichonephila clavipes]